MVIPVLAIHGVKQDTSIVTALRTSKVDVRMEVVVMTSSATRAVNRATRIDIVHRTTKVVLAKEATVEAKVADPRLVTIAAERVI